MLTTYNKKEKKDPPTVIGLQPILKKTQTRHSRGK